MADMYPDIGGSGASQLQRGVALQMQSSPRVVADYDNIDPPAVQVDGPNEAFVECHTGEDNGEGASNPTSNIATRIKATHRTHIHNTIFDSLYIMTRAQARQIKKTTNE